MNTDKPWHQRRNLPFMLMNDSSHNRGGKAPHRGFNFIELLVALAFTWASAAADPVTRQRIEQLPSAERAAWMAYVERSQAAARADQAAIDAEVAASHLPGPKRAPSGGDFKLSARMGDAWYASDEAGRLADVVLSYQTPAGGWSKHTGYSRGPRQPGMQFTSQNEPGQKPHYVATFDNRATTEEMCFLAGVWHATKREDCKAGFTKALDFILSAQYPNGGWPQVYPLEGKYHDNITFNDDAMTRILELLQDIENGEPFYAFVDDTQRAKANVALDKGLACLLNVQFVQDGRKTGWCAQYDPLSLQPAAARAMEPVALSGLESSRILRCLMTISNPAPEIVAAIEDGLSWLDEVKLTGLTKTTVDGKTAYVRDASSTQVYWARFYRLTDSKPVFPGRDGVLYDTFEAMAASNRLGYDFYTTLPGSVVNNGQKKWRKMMAGAAQKPTKP